MKRSNQMTLGACALGVIFTSLLLCAGGMYFIGAAFSGFGGREEFTNVSGSAAKRRLRHAWPAAVDPDSVASVDYKTQWSRDSYSTWYRIKLAKTAAAAWMDVVYANQERSVTDYAETHRDVEGIHRTVLDPPPLHQQTGTTPAWWSPPRISFRATEIMLWCNHGSGVGRATNSAFDESTKMLWIYDYAAEGDVLWSHGSLPNGDLIE